MKKNWWKILAVILLLYTVIAGLLMDVPQLREGNLDQTIRNLHFHVPMWFGMMIFFTVSLVYSIRYLRSNDLKYDHKALEFVNIGIVFGILGLATGSIWVRFTWTDAWWVNDPRLNGAAITMLVYLAYTVLRGSLEDEQQKARISNIYNIFAYAVMIPLIVILPRMTQSLHPGTGGNPGFNVYDLDNNLRKVFYPAVIGWTLLGLWIASLRIRLKHVSYKLEK
ncbi:MAG: cytochrome c biogenesis protein CcsA [Bacteroidota bacterium]